MMLIRSRSARSLAAIVTAAALLAACGGDGDATSLDDSTTAAAADQSTTPDGEPFNPTDVSFVQNMLPHHMQAARNAQILLDGGSDPEVMAIAQGILDTQQMEIDTMQGFLEAFGASAEPAPADQQAVWDANTAALQNASTPEELEVVFLTNMVPHHSAAVPMSQLELEKGVYEPAQTLAMEIKTTQRMEIMQMNEIIRRRATPS